MASFYKIRALFQFSKKSRGDIFPLPPASCAPIVRDFNDDFRDTMINLAFEDFFFNLGIQYILGKTLSSWLTLILKFFYKYAKWWVLDELMMNYFCGMVDWRMAFSLIFSREHCQGFLLLQISDKPWVGFEPAQNLLRVQTLLKHIISITIFDTPSGSLPNSFVWRKHKLVMDMLQTEFNKSCF